MSQQQQQQQIPGLPDGLVDSLKLIVNMFNTVGEGPMAALALEMSLMGDYPDWVRQEDRVLVEEKVALARILCDKMKSDTMPKEDVCIWSDILTHLRDYHDKHENGAAATRASPLLENTEQYVQTRHRRYWDLVIRKKPEGIVVNPVSRARNSSPGGEGNKPMMMTAADPLYRAIVKLHAAKELNAPQWYRDEIHFPDRGGGPDAIPISLEEWFRIHRDHRKLDKTMYRKDEVLPMSDALDDDTRLQILLTTLSPSVLRAAIAPYVHTWREDAKPDGTDRWGVLMTVIAKTKESALKRFEEMRKIHYVHAGMRRFNPERCWKPLTDVRYGWIVYTVDADPVAEKKAKKEEEEEETPRGDDDVDDDAVHHWAGKIRAELETLPEHRVAELLSPYVFVIDHTSNADDTLRGQFFVSIHQDLDKAIVQTEIWRRLPPKRAEVISVRGRHVYHYYDYPENEVDGGGGGRV